MATIGAQGLQRASLSSERAQRTIKAIETYVGVKVGSDTSNNSSSETISFEQQLEFDFSRSMDKT